MGRIIGRAIVFKTLRGIPERETMVEIPCRFSEILLTISPPTKKEEM